jgi:hypothetical protein
VLGARFDEQPLEKILKSQLGDMTLASDKFRVGLMVIVKRADTGSVWVLVNVPGHRFWRENRDMRLWEIVRSSTAAPTFFRHQHIADVGGDEEAIFVDGGVSMHNNPALQLLMAATLSGFGLRWPLGADNLLVCSIGTGHFTPTYSPQAFRKFTNLNWSMLLITQFMHDASELNQTILQWLSESPTARTIDLQIGDLQEDLLTRPPLISYTRYNVDLQCDALARIGITIDEDQVSALREMSNVDAMEQLDAVGCAAASAHVEPHHFPAAVDRVRLYRR